jgi:hypothetical protein
MLLTMGVGHRSTRPRQSAPGPVGAPPIQARSPRPYGHAHWGATHQVWGHGLRTADLWSRPANIRSGGPPIHAAPTRPWPTSARPPPTGHLESDAPCGHQEPLTGGSALDGAVPYQKVKRVGHGFRNFTNYRVRLLLNCGVTWQTHLTVRLRGSQSL